MRIAQLEKKQPFANFFEREPKEKKTMTNKMAPQRSSGSSSHDIPIWFETLAFFFHLARPTVQAAVDTD